MLRFFFFQIVKLEFIALARQRPWLPLGGKLSQKTPKVDFGTDEGNWLLSASFPLIRLAFARHLPPRGKVRGAVRI